ARENAHYLPVLSATTLISLFILLSLLLPPRPPRLTLFPYTTLFPISAPGEGRGPEQARAAMDDAHRRRVRVRGAGAARRALRDRDRKSTRLNSSHVSSSYAVCCLKKKKTCLIRPRQPSGHPREYRPHQ